MARRWNNMEHLIILRGLPGSGKSNKRNIEYGSGETFSTDDYFRDVYGNMVGFHARHLNEAHRWNRQRVLEAMREGVHPIIVDNTNLEIWEMWPYVRMGKRRGYYISFWEEPNDISLEHRFRICGGNITLRQLEKMERRFEPVYNIWMVLHDQYSLEYWMPHEERVLNRW